MPADLYGEKNDMSYSCGALAKPLPLRTTYRGG